MLGTTTLSTKAAIILTAFKNGLGKYSNVTVPKSGFIQVFVQYISTLNFNTFSTYYFKAYDTLSQYAPICLAFRPCESTAAAQSSIFMKEVTFALTCSGIPLREESHWK
jgi:hypothetical protein